jgi:hypothetical protein
MHCSEVKEYCTALIQAEFLAVGSSATISQSITRQLAGYTYTFPMALNVSPIFLGKS